MPRRLLPYVLDVISQYDIPLTVRQIYYRLVAAGVIKNSRSSFNSLDKCIVRARLNGDIPFEKIEDRSRVFLAGDFEFEEPDDYMAWRIDSLKQSAELYEVPYWMFQPEYVEVWLEKDALSALFRQVCDKLHVVLAACRGYPSLTYLYKAAQRLMNVGKPITILYFGDYDPRGKDIQRYITETLNREFDLDVRVERVALTREQIERYDLPPDLTKKTDTLARKWIEIEGDNVWELDALEPKLLMHLVEQAILEHFSMEAFEKRNAYLNHCRQRIREILEEIFPEGA